MRAVNTFNQLKPWNKEHHVVVVVVGGGGGGVGVGVGAGVGVGGGGEGGGGGGGAPPGQRIKKSWRKARGRAQRLPPK